MNTPCAVADVCKLHALQHFAQQVCIIHTLRTHLLHESAHELVQTSQTYMNNTPVLPCLMSVLVDCTHYTDFVDSRDGIMYHCHTFISIAPHTRPQKLF